VVVPCGIELANASHGLPWPAVLTLLFVLAIGKTTAQVITACAAYRRAGLPRQDPPASPPGHGCRSAAALTQPTTETPQSILDRPGSATREPRPDREAATGGCRRRRRPVSVAGAGR